MRRGPLLEEAQQSWLVVSSAPLQDAVYRYNDAARGLIHIPDKAAEETFDSLHVALEADNGMVRESSLSAQPVALQHCPHVAKGVVSA
jgi:hypothetical protein